MTLDRAVKIVPKTSERKVKAGSPSSRSDTTNRDTSMPTRARGSVMREKKNEYNAKQSLTIANDGVAVHIFDVVVS